MVDPVATSSTFWDVKASGLLKPITDVISAVAWPAATVMILRLFKGEILKLIPFLSKFKAMGVEAEFTRGLDKAEVEVAKMSTASKGEPPQDAPPSDPSSPTTPPSTPPMPPADTSPTRTVTADFVGTYSVEGPSASDPIALRANPTGIVMESWKALEAALGSLSAEAIEPKISGRPYSPLELVKRLSGAGLIGNEELDMLLNLIRLRNLAAHASDPITAAEAARFNEVASRLTMLYRAKANAHRLNNERKRTKAA